MAAGGVTLLAIESATDMVGVALIRDDGASAERVHDGGRAHAELLVPAIEEVCAVSGCTIADVDRIAVDVGPGLFTGLRVGVATAKALAQALGVGIVGVSSLDILAAAFAEESAGAASDGSAGSAAVTGSTPWSRWWTPDGARCSPPPTVSTGRSTRSGASRSRLRPPRPARADRTRRAGGVAGRAGRGRRPGRSWWATAPSVTEHLLPSTRRSISSGRTELSAPPPLAQATAGPPPIGGRGRPLTALELVPDYRRPADARINWEQRAPRDGRHRGGSRTRVTGGAELARTDAVEVVIAPMRSRGPEGRPPDRGGGVPPAVVPPALRGGAVPAEVPCLPGRLGRTTGSWGSPARCSSTTSPT